MLSESELRNFTPTKTTKMLRLRPACTNEEGSMAAVAAAAALANNLNSNNNNMINGICIKLNYSKFFCLF